MNRVSLILTVLDEEGGLRDLLDSLCLQTRAPDEIVVVDGGSRDRTVSILREYRDRLPLRVEVAPGCNISEGRNLAIHLASHDRIASTDAGVRLSPRWLERLLEPLDAAAPAPAVAGVYRSAPRTAFETALGATVIPGPEEIAPRSFLPSSRSVAFTRNAWERAGGYPEWLDYCEDLVFDLRLRGDAGAFAFAPEAVADFRPRPDLAAFFVQYYRYARGDGKADLWPLRHAIRYGTYLVALPGLAAAGTAVPWVWAVGAVAAVAGLFLRPYRRLRRAVAALPPGQRLRAALWVPVVRVTGDVAKMVGYPAGRAWRLRNRRRDRRLEWRR